MNTLVNVQEKAPNITTSVSFNGYEFNTEDDIWILSKDKRINVGFITNFDIRHSAANSRI